MAVQPLQPAPPRIVKPRFSLREAFLPLVSNPVVMRDLRIQLRGTKSYWYQAVYLLLVGLLAVAGYATATSGFGRGNGAGGVSVVQAQSQLQQFYYFIFATLAALICLIAPALTAASITTERQRLTLDLLITTPLSAGELLVGKLLSSIAFLALLLVLSLPASALCVILGGATLGDVFRVYILFALDGLILAAIGLYFSCAVRASLLALVWTYVTVFLFEMATMTMGAFTSVGAAFMGGDGNAFSCFTSLNPFVAMAVGGKSFEASLPGFGPTKIPIWLGASVLTVLIVRLLVTAAAFRLGTYGASAAPSLRRQILFLTGLTAFAMAYGLFDSTGSFPGRPTFAGGSDGALAMMVLLITGFSLATFLLPSLFVPAVAEDAPVGTAIDGWYKVKRMFQPDHAGSLPYFHLWLLVLAGSALAGAQIARGGSGGVSLLSRPDILLGTLFYLSGMGTLLWAISRRAGTLVKAVSGARALAFGLFLLVTAFPLMIFSVSNQNWEDSSLVYLWLFLPLARVGKGDALLSLLIPGIISYGLSVIVFPFWSRVVPGGAVKTKEKKEKATAKVQ